MPLPPERLVLIADRCTEVERWPRFARALEGGVRWVLLRDREAEAEDFAATVPELANFLRSHRESVYLSVSGDLEVAQQLQAGLHIGNQDVPLEEARAKLGGKWLIGFSSHNYQEVEYAYGKANYVFFGPVFRTLSKPGHPGVGVHALQEVTQAFKELPIFALGGVLPERVPACLQAGAYGIAVHSGILDAPDPAERAAQYLYILNRTFPE